jgi:hypothetical protein
VLVTEVVQTVAAAGTLTAQTDMSVLLARTVTMTIVGSLMYALSGKFVIFTLCSSVSHEQMLILLQKVVSRIFEDGEQEWNLK